MILFIDDNSNGGNYNDNDNICNDNNNDENNNCYNNNGDNLSFDIIFVKN